MHADRNEFRSIGASVISQHHTVAVAARFTRALIIIIILRCGRIATASHLAPSLTLPLPLRSIVLFLNVLLRTCTYFSAVFGQIETHTNLHKTGISFLRYVFHRRTVRCVDQESSGISSCCFLLACACIFFLCIRFPYKTVAACKLVSEYAKQQRQPMRLAVESAWRIPNFVPFLYSPNDSSMMCAGQAP